MHPIYTVGYEGAGSDDFFAALKAASVAYLADVRAVPHSRKKGFSKRALIERCAAEDIRYVSAVELGDPKAGREAARAGRYDDFRTIYSAHLGGQESQRRLEQLFQLAIENATCLMCFERDPSVCHRSLIADAMLGRGMLISHLQVLQRQGSTTRVDDLAGCHFGQGVAAG